MTTRIYVVTHTQGAEAPRLVETASAAQAIRHVVSEKYDSRVATTKEVVACMSEGIAVEKPMKFAPDAARNESRDAAIAEQAIAEEETQTAHEAH